MIRMKKLVSCFVLLLIATTLFISADSVYSTENDPLITLSYAQTTLKNQIVNEVLAAVNNSSQLPAASSGYEVIHMTQGQTLMAKSACEVIMTMGVVKVVVTDQANLSNKIGLNDVTASCRILNGEAFECNHYIIIPRGDGRGFTVTCTDAYFMVRGEYTIA